MTGRGGLGRGVMHTGRLCVSGLFIGDSAVEIRTVELSRPRARPQDQYRGGNACGRLSSCVRISNAESPINKPTIFLMTGRGALARSVMQTESLCIHAIREIVNKLAASAASLDYVKFQALIKSAASAASRKPKIQGSAPPPVVCKPGHRPGAALEHGLKFYRIRGDAGGVC